MGQLDGIADLLGPTAARCRSERSAGREPGVSPGDRPPRHERL